MLLASMLIDTLDNKLLYCSFSLYFQFNECGFGVGVSEGRGVANLLENG